MKRRLLLLPATIVALHGLWGQEHAFQASGVFETISPSGTNRAAFAFGTDGRDVSIRMNKGTADQGIEYRQFGTDNRTGYDFTKYEQRTGSAPGRSPVNDATMNIRASPEPTPFSGNIRILWLVYAAEREWRGRNSDYCQPNTPVWLRETPFDQELAGLLYDHLRLRAEWTFHDAAPYCLSNFVDYRDGLLEPGRRGSRIIPDEFTSGVTNSRLDILSWTNAASLVIPLQGRVTYYMRNTNQPAAPLLVQFTQRFEVTNLVVGSAPRSLVPEATRATRVLDSRITSPNRPAEYLSTNGVIFPDPEEAWAEMQRQQEEARQRREKRKEAPPGTKN